MIAFNAPLRLVPNRNRIDLMTARSSPPSADTLTRVRSVLGTKGVIDNPNDMAAYLEEPRGRWTGQTPLIARPSSTEEVAKLVHICADTQTALVPQSGNTGLVGGQIPESHEIVVSTDRLTNVRQVDIVNNTITAEAGCILSHLQDLADTSDRLFPLSLASEGSARLGGVLSTNAGGNNVLRYGNARDLTLGLEVVTPKGAIWSDLSGLRKDNTGYDLKHLFMGAEGTLGIITAATIQLFPKPQQTETAFVAMRDIEACLDLLGEAKMLSGDCVSSFELIPRIALDFQLTHQDDARDPLAQKAEWYILFELTSSMPGHHLRTVMEHILEVAVDTGLITDGTLAANKRQRAALWALRESISEIQKREGASHKHDISVPVSAIPQFLSKAITAVSRAVPGIRPVPFGHIGDGNIHFNLSQPKDSSRAAYDAQRDDIAHLVYDIVADLGGSFSAEHGIGIAKKQDLNARKDPTALALMRQIKKALDPDGIMNPGKML